MSEDEFEILFLKTIVFLEERYARRIDYLGPEVIDSHLMKVFTIIASIIETFDAEILIAALLHKVIIDTNSTIDEIKKLFGDHVSALVKELTPERSYHQYHFYYPFLKSKKAVIIHLASLIVSIVGTKECHMSSRLIKENVIWHTEIGDDNGYC